MLVCLTHNYSKHRGSNGTSAVTELIQISDTILTLQFRMATSCGADDSGSIAVLEVSKDDGANWEQVHGAVKLISSANIFLFC